MHSRTSGRPRERRHFLIALNAVLFELAAMRTSLSELHGQVDRSEADSLLGRLRFVEARVLAIIGRLELRSGGTSH